MGRARKETFKDGNRDARNTRKDHVQNGCFASDAIRSGRVVHATHAAKRREEDERNGDSDSKTWDGAEEGSNPGDRSAKNIPVWSPFRKCWFITSEGTHQSNMSTGGPTDSDAPRRAPAEPASKESKGKKTEKTSLAATRHLPSGEPTKTRSRNGGDDDEVAKVEMQDEDGNDEDGNPKIKRRSQRGSERRRKWYQDIHGYKEQAKTRSQRGFREGTRYERVSKFDPQAPSAEFRRTSKMLTRAETSIIVQLRIGHIPLMSYLHRFKLAESPICPKYGDEPETVTHYLKIWEGYKEPRRALKRELGRDSEIGLELLREKKHIKAVLRYIRRTGRFEETHKNLGENDDG
jgi:hypothetical protein